MMLKEQKPKPNLSQRQAPTKIVPRSPSSRMTDFTGLQPRYYETGAKPSVFPMSFVHSGSQTYSGGPTYVYDAADRIRAPFAENRSPSALSGQKTIQRVVKIDDAVVKKVTSKQVESYVNASFPGLSPKDAKNLAKKLKDIANNMIKEKNDDNPHRFKDIPELLKFIYDNYLKPMSAPTIKSTPINILEDFYGQVLRDMQTILPMTPMQFEVYMINALKIPNLTIETQASAKDSPTCIVRNYRSDKSHIAGTITYTYHSPSFKLFIEIHPKGGIHYCAYFMIELSYGSSINKQKMIYSKPSTYLPANEKDVKPVFMRKNETALPLMPKFIRNNETALPLMSKLPLMHYEHPQKGTDTPEKILNIPIQNIFSKKELRKESIWTEKTRASVEMHRDRIRRERIAQIARLQPADLSPSPDELISPKEFMVQKKLMIQNELMMIDKRLDSLEAELSDPASIDPARYESISHELERIRSSLDELEAIIDDLIAKREQA